MDVGIVMNRQEWSEYPKDAWEVLFVILMLVSLLCQRHLASNL